MEKIKVLDRLPPLWRERFEILGRLAADRKIPLCLVGGSVRDILLERPPLDWDVIGEGDVSLLVRDAAKRFSAGVVEHPAFLTFTLHFHDGTSLDVATARREIYDKPAALPRVEPAPLREDFRRRDFTVNAMSVHLAPDRWGELADPLGGWKDLRRGTVRALHAGSFRDDPTRIYRAARYAGRYGYKVDTKTLSHLRAAVKAGLPGRLSAARRRNELACLLRETDARAAMKLLRDWGLWSSWDKAWAWDRFVEKALAPRSSGDLTVFRLAALYHAASPAAARKGLAAMSFPRSVGDAVALGLECWGALRKNRQPACSYRKLPPVVLEFLKARGAPPVLLGRWGHSEPLITGMDLNDWGYAPGPVYQKIFDAVRGARWKGSAMSFAEEKRFVFDNFPRKE